MGWDVVWEEAWNGMRKGPLLLKSRGRDRHFCLDGAFGIYEYMDMGHGTVDGGQ